MIASSDAILPRCFLLDTCFSRLPDLFHANPRKTLDLHDTEQYVQYEIFLPLIW